MKLLVAILLLTLTSCTFTVDRNDLHKSWECVDFRDGEIYRYDSKTMHDIMLIGYNEYRAKIVTHAGDTLTVSTKMDAYIKCSRIDTKATPPISSADRQY